MTGKMIFLTNIGLLTKYSESLHTYKETLETLPQLSCETSMYYAKQLADTEDISTPQLPALLGPTGVCSPSPTHARQIIHTK